MRAQSKGQNAVGGEGGSTVKEASGYNLHQEGYILILLRWHILCQSTRLSVT